MDREESQIHMASKRERLTAVTIIFFMLLSFFLHLFAFSEILLKNIEEKDNQTDTYFNDTTKVALLKDDSDMSEIFDINLLPCFCIMAHLIWTIVPIVVLDQCCMSNKKSVLRIMMKLLICTCPILLCSELSLIFVCHIKHVKHDLLLIIVKWLIFLATILIAFWTGTLSKKDKWRGIHGGQIAPEQQSPLYLF